MDFSYCDNMVTFYKSGQRSITYLLERVSDATVLLKGNIALARHLYA